MTITDSARRLALVAIVAMLAALMPLSGALAQDPPTDPPADGDREAVDLDGDTNVDYALRWSQLVYPNAAVDAGDGPTEALIARDDVFADSLASGSLQGGAGLTDDAGRPLLLTPSDALSEAVSAELERLGVDTVTILGNEDAVSQDVVDELEADYTVNRLGGETRIETAIEVAETVDSDTAILARGFANDDPTQAFADSLAAGGWAAEDNIPVLFTQTEVLTGNTRDHIAEAGYSNIIIVGGELAISGDVESELTDSGVTVERVAGDNRFETAVAIAEARGYENPDTAEGIILVDGQGADAWADGFPAANLSGQGWPIVLSNSADDALPGATVEYLERSDEGDAAPAFAAHLGDVVLVCGSTVPDGDGTSQSDQCSEAAELLGATVTEFTPPGETNVTVSATEVAAGDELTVTIADAQPGSEIVISGCGVNQTVTISDDHEGDAPITVTIPANQAAGDCELSVTIDGEEQGPFTITVVAPACANPNATEQPELCRAELGATTTASQANATNPAGTLVTFFFDEPVNSANANQFRVYTNDNRQFVGTTVVGFTPGQDQVTVRFTGVATTALREVLSLAGVNFAAVVAADGERNPEGSAPIGAASTSTGQAGTTEAPDLLTVSGFRPGTPNTVTAVDFTFDENAFVQNPNNFELIPGDGSAPIPCQGSNNPASPSGGTVAGGSGTTVITVTCTNPTGAGNYITQGSIARGVAMMNAVADTAGNNNPLQAAIVTGFSSDPDLQSAEFQLGATNASGAAVDRVIYVFDQPVATTNATSPNAGFNVYTQAAATIQNGNVVQVTNTGNTGRVAVDFQDGALQTAVGASVDQGTVQATTGGGQNENDEAGVENTAATVVTPGETTGPQLTSVTLAEGTDATGASTGFRATYVFDEDVDLETTGNFLLYQADGDQLVANNCTNPTAEDTDNTVTCQFIQNGPPAVTSADVQSSVVGAVAADAVREEGAAATPGAFTTASNPEGAELTTGGNGTPTS